ncbi:glycosyltransferase [Kaistella faecalis]|uniref:glycosyltransferase n=1 Tax=Kaistella faecalis TaxID=2852098 RepID=UPI001C487536|nr:glycosyltransferase [Chryseobacterium faecale]UFK97097.1 glycosyltransferase [Chryseobacterium faecale]
MKVLKITTLLDFGGQEKQYVSFTEKPELLKNHYIFAAIGHGGSAEKFIREKGFPVHILNRNFSIKNLCNIWTVYKLIKKVKPDVVHTAAAEANFHGIIAAKLAGVKYIIGEEIGIPNHSPIGQKIFSLVYRLADQVICVSQSVKKHLVKTGEIPQKKGVVIYNPVSVPKNYTLNRTAKFNLVYVGRLEKVKNVESLIHAFSQIKEDHLQLTVVGDGRERVALENLVNQLGLKDSIVFEGYQSEPAKFLCIADLYVLPSYTEGFGIAAVEAMFLKIPVLATQVGGVPEFINHGVNGWLFNPDSVEDLVGKLTHILSLCKHERQLIGEKGFEEVSNRFTVDKYVDNLENLYSLQS